MWKYFGYKKNVFLSRTESLGGPMVSMVFRTFTNTYEFTGTFVKSETDKLVLGGSHIQQKNAFCRHSKIHLDIFQDHFFDGVGFLSWTTLTLKSLLWRIKKCSQN